MDDVDVLPGENLAEILVAFAIRAACLDCVCQMLLIHVANREELAGFVDAGDMPHAHAARADDGAREDFAGRRDARPTEDVPRHDADGGERGDGGLEEVPAREKMSFVHGDAR